MPHTCPPVCARLWHHGIALAVSSSLVFSGMNVMVKALSPAVGVAQIGFFRGAVGLLAVLWLMRRQRVAFSRAGVPWLALRGLLGALYLLAYFYTLAHMPLADAAALIHTAPVFVLLLSALLLQERLGAAALRWAALALAGAALIINPLGYASFNLAALAGVAAAFFEASASVAVRHLGRRHHALEIIFYFLAAVTVTCGALMLPHWVWPTPRQWALLLGMALVSLLGQALLTRAYVREKAATVAFVRYIGIVFSAAWGLALWGELPGWHVALGAVLVVCGCMGLSRATAVQAVENNGEKNT